MKRLVAFSWIVLTIVLTTIAATAHGQVAYMHLNHRDTTARTFATTNENTLAEIKNAFTAANATITQEDNTSFTAEMPNSAWAWETKEGTPDNDKAIVVINKKYDIGSNMIKKPRSVTTIWQVTLAADKKSYSLQVKDVLSIYQHNTKNRTGYSTGLWEEKVRGVVR
jgi:hypothetical protein